MQDFERLFNVFIHLWICSYLISKFDKKFHNCYYCKSPLVHLILLKSMFFITQSALGSLMGAEATVSPISKLPLKTAQYAERISNKILITFHETFAGWDSMHKRSRMYFSQNPRLKAIKSISLAAFPILPNSGWIS